MKKTLKIAVATLGLAAFATTAQAEGDLVKGEKVFKKCKVCHMIGEGAKKKIGPPLNNIIDAKAGAQEGFKYSKAMKAAGEGGLMWSVEKLDEYLKKPKKLVPKSKMNLPGGGLKKDADRENVIAYIKTFSKMEKKDKKP